MAGERRRASIEAITSGAVIFGAAVGYVTIRNQLAPLGQVVAVSVIGFFIFLWLAVFGTPIVRPFWSVVRQGKRANENMSARIEALEKKHDELTKIVRTESQNTVAIVSLLELDREVDEVHLSRERLTQEEMTERLGNILGIASAIVQNLDLAPNPERFEKVVKSAIAEMILTAALKEVPFERTASTLISGLGVSIAKRIVDVSSILVAYGMDYATKWQDMVGRS